MESKKKLSLWFITVVMVLAMALSASATVEILEVELDDTILSESGENSYSQDRGEEVNLKIKLTSDTPMKNVQVEAVIRGYDHDDLIQDISSSFDMKADTTYIKRLKIPVRYRLDPGDYRLRVRVDDANGDTVFANFDLVVEAVRHDMIIRDVILNPENEVKAGRALLVSVRVENNGQKDEDDVKVQVSIPELGVSATSYIDEVEHENENDGGDDKRTSEEMFLRIPSDALTGEYTLRATVTYDEGDETVTKEVTVRVVGAASVADATDNRREEKTIITLASDLQNVQAGGAEVSFPVTLTNAGSSSKVYTVMVDGGNWGTFSVSPSNVLVVDSGESKAVSVNVGVNANAAAGLQTFLLTVQADGKVLKQIPLKANVAPAGKDYQKGNKVKTGLEVGLIVLLILVVVIGLILGFTRRSSDDDSNKEDGDSYY